MSIRARLGRIEREVGALALSPPVMASRRSVADLAIARLDGSIAPLAYLPGMTAEERAAGDAFCGDLVQVERLCVEAGLPTNPIPWGGSNWSPRPRG